MKNFYILLFLLTFLITDIFSQTIQLGSGTATNGTTTSSPVNIWYRRTVAQFVYTAAELNAAGINGPCDLQDLGWYITQSPIYNIPGYTVKVKHVTVNNVAAALGTTGWTTVKSSFTYNPTAGGWDMLGLNNVFTWNGIDNIGVEVCWSQVTPSYSSSGQCRIYSTSSGYRYSWTDGAGNSCGLSPSSTTTNKPQVQMVWGCAPPCTTPSPPNASGTTISCGSQATLTASGAPGNGNYIWYSDANGNNQVGTGSSFTTPTLSTNTTYYVSVFVPINCESSLVPVTVNVNSNVSNPTTNNININCGDLATLTVTGSTGNYEWFSDANGNNSIGTGNAISLGNLYADSTVYVAATLGSSCTPQIETFDNQSIPSGWTSTNSIASTSANAFWKYGGVLGYNMNPTNDHTGNNGSFAWVDGSSPYPAVVTLNSPTYPQATYTSLSFYMKRAANTTITNFNSFSVDFFNGTAWYNAIFTHNTSTANSDWEQFSINLASISISGNVRFRFNVNKNGTPYPFYDDIAIDDVELVCGSSSCLSNLVPVTVTVNGPTPPTANGITINCGDSATLTASGSTGNYEWFSDSTGNNSIGTGNSISLGTLNSDSTVYVIATSGSQAGPPTVIYNEDWQNGNGGWTLGNSGPYWNRISGGTTSTGTGPNGGSNNGTPTNGNFYVYLETSTGAGTAYLTGPGFTITGAATLEFDYHMYGSAMGTLAVEVFNGTSWTQVWSLSGQQQNSNAASWTTVSVPLTNYTGNINIRFSGLRGSSFTSDMAIDNISISETQTSSCFSSLIPVTAITNCSPLPVKLISFNSECVNGLTSLKWQTASEVNSDYFQIERSIDGIDWYEISKVTSSGFSNNIVNYEFIDINSEGFDGYYRLKQVDFDGKFEYSNYIYVSNNNCLQDNNINIYPNPAQEELFIRITNSTSGEGILIITDISGKVVKQELLNLSHKYSLIDLDVTGLSKGIYTIKITSNGVKFIDKFIKN